jgi:Icc-related predicted phosphoesterase
VLTHKGLSFFGIEGSMRYNDSPLQYTESEITRIVVSAAPRLMYRRQRLGSGVDFLVTHSPVHGIHDAPDLPHRGFKGLLRFLDWYRPRYMVHGHVHTYDRRTTTRTQYQDTCIININPITVLDVEPVER